MTRNVEIRRFRAKSETGKEYIIIESQNFISARSFESPNGEVAGLKSLFTSMGLSVNYIDSETFQIVQTGEIIRKI